MIIVMVVIVMVVIVMVVIVMVVISASRCMRERACPRPEVLLLCQVKRHVENAQCQRKQHEQESVCTLLLPLTFRIGHALLRQGTENLFTG